MKKFIIISCLIASFTACTSVDPYTREEKVNNTTKGAVGGAVVGAVIGQIAGKDTKSTIKGALGGAGVGAGVGYYFDRQEAELRAELDKTGVGIERVGENQLQLVMPGNLTFDTGSSAIAPSAYEVLNSVSTVLAKYKDSTLTISGHTDSTGSDTINSKLSKERADSVTNYLAAQGVARMRMDSVGLGSKYPVADNSTTSGRTANRRVEIQITGTSTN